LFKERAKPVILSAAGAKDLLLVEGKRSVWRLAVDEPVFRVVFPRRVMRFD
jgi:hypothetical protein